MKNTVPVVILILFFAIIAADIVEYEYLENSARALSKNATVVIENVENGKWKQAQGNVESLEKQWDRLSNVWNILIDHNELDSIEESLTRMQQYINTKSSTMAITESYNLRRLINHIPENEALKLKNVL